MRGERAQCCGTIAANAPGSGLSTKTPHDDDDELHNKPAHAVPLASARQRPENQKENQVGHSPERAVEGQAKTCQNAAARRQQGGVSLFRGLASTAVTCRGCSQDLKDSPRASPIAFEPGHGVGGRHWRASLAGVAGGRRWRASLAGVAGEAAQKSRRFQLRELKYATLTKPDNKQRTPSGGDLRVTPRPNTAEKTPPIDLDRASQIEIERPNETREQRRNSTKGPCQKIRTNTAAETHKVL